jgi:hypothetical protein
LVVSPFGWIALPVDTGGAVEEDDIDEVDDAREDVELGGADVDEVPA